MTKDCLLVFRSNYIIRVLQRASLTAVHTFASALHVFLSLGLSKTTSWVLSRSGVPDVTHCVAWLWPPATHR